MKKFRLGLRLRIALALALACLLVVGALGVTLYTASEDMEESLITQLIAEEMDFLVARHRANPDYQPQPSSNLQSYIARNRAEQEKLPPVLLGLGVGRHEFFVGKDEHHALVSETAGTRYIVVYEVGLHEEREKAFQLLIVVSVLFAAGVSLALGFWLSGILVRQVTDLAARVGTLSPKQRSGGLARADQDTEIAMLATALDEYQSRIEQLIQREQEFTSNASHELRTPLTAIKTSCELLLADVTLGERSRTRVEWIGAAASRMESQLQALLLLARGESPGEIEPVAVADCVAEAVEPVRAELARKGLALEVNVDRDAVLETDFAALRVVLGNLLRNAVRYTEQGTIRISYEPKRLSVSDTGRGIAPEHMPRLFERHFRAEPGGAGAGIGLAIVKRICDHYGWRIEARSRPQEGSAFSILFP